MLIRAVTCALALLAQSEQGTPPVIGDAGTPIVASSTVPAERELLIVEPLVIVTLEPDLALVIERDGDVIFVEAIGGECLNLAKQACGEGNVCWLRVVVKGDGSQECEFTCRDANGECPKSAYAVT